MPSNLFDGLNNAQLQAVTSESKIILCLAGAGSGKTTVLTRRIANLQLNHRVGTSNMLALTFTRLAGKEMKERVIKLIGEELGKKLFCNTFHAFAAGVLRIWGHKLGIDKDFTIYDQEDRESVITRICIDFGNKAKPGKVCELYENGGAMKPEERRVIDEYEYRLRQNNAVDLSRLIWLVVELFINNPDVLEQFRIHYTHVFVDEFQDTSDDQMELLQLLKPQHLFVVGDDFQAIYGWRRAKVEYILDFPNHFPRCEVVKLEDNYRSSDRIVDAANTLIKHNVRQTQKQLIAHKAGADVYIFNTESPNRENVMITKMIRQLQEKGTKLNDIAVLARTNKQLTNLMLWMEQAQIQYQMVSGGDDVFKSQSVKPILDWMNFLHNRKDTIGLKKCLEGFIKPGNDLQKCGLQFESMVKNISLYEAMQVYKDDSNHFAFAFMNKVSQIETDLNSSNNYLPSECYNILDNHLGLSEKYKSSCLSARFNDFQRALDYITLWETTKRNLGEDHSIQTFLKWLRYRDIQERLMETKEAVKLMTVHASKGLEFDTVFIAGMNQGVFPSRRSTDMDEERRLFYVAITRAKNNLYVSYPHVIADWRGNPEQAEPSQFIKEMMGLSAEKLLHA